MATTAESLVKPPVTAAQAQATLAALYGIEGTAEELTGELDRNFLIKTPAAERYVLKIYHQAADPAVLDFQNRALAHVASRDPSVGVATVMPDRNGRETASLTLPDGSTRLVRLLSWIPGSLMADATQVSAETLESLGGYLARLDRALADFSHPGQQRAILWAISAAPQHRRLLEYIENTRLRDRVTGILDRFASQVSPALRGERRQVVHHDANPHNVLIDDSGQVAAVIDFGDMVEDHLVAELAVACTYAMFGQPDPIKAVLPLIAGYHDVNPLTDGELAPLLDLVRTRLAQSICMSAWQHSRDPENVYLLVDRDDVTALLERLARVNDRFALFQFRAACGLPANPATPALMQWLESNGDRIGPICRHDLATAPLTVFDWTAGSRELAELNALRDVPARSALLFQWLERAGSVAGVGRYLENRAVYTDRLFQTDDAAEPRSVHLGIDLFLPSREVVMAPLDGRVHLVANNPAPGDYGPMIVLEHRWDGGVFWTLYGHLSIDSLDGMKPGRTIARGDMIGRIGTFPTNGNWVPHLHFQIITDFVGRGADIEGVAKASEVDVWESISPDPNILLGIRDPGANLPSRPRERVLRERRHRLGRSLSLSYRQPIKMVRGEGQYLYDEAGNAWLDMVNNVCHVGHCHPRVVRAGQQQMAALNTNTRYLHDAIVEYSRRLTETLPEPLNVCFFVNSGSEANDLALRLARAHTGGSDVLVVDTAYHGNLTSLIEISPYKFNGPGGSGRPAHVRVCPMPDDYRGRWKRDDPEAGRRYAGQAVEQLERIQSDGRRLTAFFCESMLSCGGQIVLPPGYLREVYAHVRAAGGVCVADEVQVGFGRAGSHMWAFETQDIVPDIVTMGKPIGNGHPLGAVITTPAIAASFANGMEYFNTYGGNPVSMAIGCAVLDVIRDERLQQHAEVVGRQLLEGLEALKAHHRLIGDVRGKGLFIGVELVRDQASLEPADRETRLVVEAMNQRRILLSIDGPFHNVIKIKPPMTFNSNDAARFLAALDDVLRDADRQG